MKTHFLESLILSNYPFLLVGILELFKIQETSKNTPQYKLFFTGISLVAFGSAYYHYNPNNETLI